MLQNRHEGILLAIPLVTQDGSFVLHHHFKTTTNMFMNNIILYDLAAVDVSTLDDNIHVTVSITIY
jgi:hypothetical protein